MSPAASPSFIDRRPSLARGLALAVIAGLFLALAGAFGTQAAPLWRRLLYWIPIMAAETTRTGTKKSGRFAGRRG